MKTLLWLDDYRDPFEDDGKWLVFSPIDSPFNVIWAKSYQEFIDWIKVNGLPDAICFDHDLGDKLGPDEKTGLSCAKWLVEYIMDNGGELPAWNIQSANPVGKDNINGLLTGFKKHYNGPENL